MSHVSTKLRQSAKGQTCTFQIPGVCNRNPETTVLCHAPSEVRGIGMKGDDFHAAFGCSDCHMALDHHKLANWQEYFYWLQGIQRTQRIWAQMGLMQFPEDKKRVKPLTKVMPRRALEGGE